MIASAFFPTARRLTVALVLLVPVATGTTSAASAQGGRSSATREEPAADELIDLLRLQTVNVGATLPRPWVVRPVRGHRAPASAIVDSSGVRYLRIRGEAAAAWFVHELGQRISPNTFTDLALTWRIVEAPRGADLRAARTDDAALRVFVVFAARGIFERIPRTLFYSTGGVEPASYERASFQSTALRLIRLADTTRGAWVSTTVSPFADYARIWGGPPRAIVAVGIMQDTEQTGSRAVADVRTLSWRTQRSVVVDR